ncbi:chitinase-like protein EN03 [Anabrus simplex]|uniref:chitinase-like protein EN03 n=1 Tax=Anabrus simplex TaxID=316456 RepID=UPI0034DD95AB
MTIGRISAGKEKCLEEWYVGKRSTYPRSPLAEHKSGLGRHLTFRTRFTSLPVVKRRGIRKRSTVARINMGVQWLLLCVVAIVGLPKQTTANRVLCYYDSRSFYREGPGKMLPADIEPSLTYCTHLIYGYAKVDASNYHVGALDEQLDLDSGKGNYRAITTLKKRHPGLSVLLSVGGGADVDEPEKYLKLLEESDRRSAFISSAKTLMKQYGFDGLDLAWEFPGMKKKKDRGTLGSLWHGIKKTFGYAHSHKDEKAEEHREGFTKLVKDLQKSLKPDNLLLTATVLPNVNESLYYEAKEIPKYVDFINLMTFDFKTPERNSDEADYPAALYPGGGRDAESTADGNIRWWLEQGVSGSKIIMGIPTFARTWKLTAESKISGVPPTPADGPGEEGPYTKTPGLMSYAEICIAINPVTKGTTHTLRRVTDPSNKLGSYGFRLPDSATSEGGVWAAYEDPDTAGYKAAYTKTKSLGGIAVWDVSLDDFRGVCTGDKFPIIRAAKAHL